MATYFNESAPKNGQLIRYGTSQVERPSLPDWASVGRWMHGWIITTNLEHLDPYDEAGYCWEPATGTLQPAKIS